MVPTRRQTLAGAAALLGSLAGCSRLELRSADTADANPSDRPPNVAMDPPTVTLRHAESSAPIVTVAERDDGATTVERPQRRAAERGLLTTPEAASHLRIADVEGAQTARQFLADTDFDESFVLVDRGRVPACFERRLCYVTWSEYELGRTYAESYRDHDVACRVGDRDRVARFVRLPGSVDPLAVDDRTRTYRGGCPVPRWRLDETRDDDATTRSTNPRLGGGRGA